MIELTQKSLNALINRYNLNRVDSLLIVKDKLENGSLIANGFELDDFRNILVFPVSSLYYASENDIPTIIPTATKTNGELYDDTQANSVKIRQVTTGEYYVIFSFNMVSGGVHCGDMLSSNTISVDYVGNLIKSINFSNGLESGDTDNIKEINLSNNPDIFYTAIDSISLGANNTLNYGNLNPVDFESGALAGSPIKKFVFPKSIESYTIPDNCLSGCTELEEVYIPDVCVTEIGAGAFKGCSNLKYIYIGSRVQTIGDGAFSGCYDTELQFDVSVYNNYFLGELGCLLRKNNDSGHTYNIIHATSTWFTPEGLGSCHVVPATDFSPALATTYGYLTNLVSAPRVETAVDIRGHTINNLVRVNSNNYSSITSQYPTAVSGFYIPVYSLVKEIEEGACSENPFITHLDFNQNSVYFWVKLNKIGKEAFKGCDVLSSITIPNIFNSTITIGEEAFSDCSSLLNANIYRRVSIDTKAFYNTGLVNLVFGYNPTFPVTSYQWFSNTPDLESITCSGTYNNNPGGGGRDIGMVIAFNQPTSSSTPTPLNALMKRENNAWSLKVGCKTTDFNTIQSTYSCTKIGSYAFYGCTDLTITNLSSNYKTIADYSFYNCTSLVLPSTAQSDLGFLYSLETIGEAAFYGCTGITSAVFGSINHISDQAFANSGVVLVNLPSTLNDILDNAFEGCTFQTVVAAQSNFAIASTEDSLNALLRHGGTTIPVCLLKSGNHSFTAVGYDYLDQIYPEAYAGVDFGNISYDYDNTIMLSGSIKKIGKHIFAHSLRTNGSTNTARLLLGARFTTANVIELTDDNKNALLFLLGGKYFKKMVDDTMQYRSTNPVQTYYYVTYDSSPLHPNIIMYEKVPNSYSNPHPVVKVEYSTSGTPAIVVTMYNVPYYDYASGGSGSHVQSVYSAIGSQFISITLMASQEFITQEMESIYFDTGSECTPFQPGSTWYGNINDSTPITIPQVTRTSKNVATGYEPSYTMYEFPTDEPFAECEWVTYVQSYRNLSNIKGAFKNCINLVDVSIHGNNNTGFNGKISESMFEGCTNFVEIGSVGYGVYIPIVYDKNCFKDCRLINHGEIEWYQFKGTTFNAGAFENTKYLGTAESALRNLNLNSPIYIDPQAFICNDYPSATSYSTCGYYFTGCGECIVDAQNKIVVGSHAYNLVGCNGIGAYAFYKSILPVTPTDKTRITILNKTAFTIGESAFAESNITWYVESGTTSGTVIGDNAFNKCLSLTTVTLKHGCTLGDTAFSECTSLTTVTLDTGCVLGDGSFSGCTAITTANLTIPFGTAISDNCFNGCTGLTSIITTSDVGASAFAGCTGLKTASISGNIGANAFNGCTSMATLNLNYSSNSTAIINPSAFNGCPLYTIDIIGNNKTSIYLFNQYGIYTYDSDWHLELVLGKNGIDGLELVSDTDKLALKTIGAHAFDGRDLSGEFTIPGSVTKIDDYAFANNPNLTHVTIPPSVEYIGDNAFAGCTNLKSFTIPDSCTYLGAGVLQGCSLERGINCNTIDDRYFTNSTPAEGFSNSKVTRIDGAINLKNIYLPSSIVDIPQDCFKDSNIRSISIPNTVAKIHKSAFMYCHKLTEVHFYASENSNILGNAFYGCENLCDIYLHDDTYTPNCPDGDPFYGVGSNYGTDTNKRHLHIVRGSRETISQTDFYDFLCNHHDFNVIEDL